LFHEGRKTTFWKESKYPQLDVDEQFIQKNTHFPGKYIRKAWNIFSVIHEK
jgi:hypothetical protein